MCLDCHKLSVPDAFDFTPELNAIVSKGCGEIVVFKAVFPSIFDYFFLEDEVGRVYVTQGGRVTAGVVIGGVKGAPESNCSKKIASHKIFNYDHIILRLLITKSAAF